jgi:recombinational DNA repair protein (RecF pathway)
MAIACFEAASETPEDLDAVLRYFEVWLLKLEGFLPDLRTCANCQKALGDESAVYLGSDLSFRCSQCSGARGRAESKRLHTQLRSAEKLSPAKFAEGAREVSMETKREMAELTFQIIGRVLERMPRIRPAS